MGQDFGDYEKLACETAGNRNSGIFVYSRPRLILHHQKLGRDQAFTFLTKIIYL